MRKLAIIISTLSVCCLLLLAPPSAVRATPAFDGLDITRPKQRLPAPGFSLPALGGGEHRLQDFQGRVLLLNFWATFCAPCREEMPALQALSEEFGDAGLAVLAVAADRGSRKPVIDFIAAGGYSFPVALDADGTVRNRYEVQALPTTYLIGADGRFLARVVGPRDWSSDEYRGLIRTLLEDSHKTGGNGRSPTPLIP